MDPLQLGAFHIAMWEELKKHKDEKTGIKNWELADVWKLTKDEIIKRTEILKTMGPDDMEKQCIHMSNYLFFLWCKLQEVKK